MCGGEALFRTACGEIGAIGIVFMGTSIAASFLGLTLMVSLGKLILSLRVCLIVVFEVVDFDTPKAPVILFVVVFVAVFFVGFVAFPVFEALAAFGAFGLVIRFFDALLSAALDTVDLSIASATLLVGIIFLFLVGVDRSWLDG